MVADPVADDSGDVSAETECATGDVDGDPSAEVDDVLASLVFDFSNTRQRYADALVDMAEHYLASDSGHRQRRAGRRYEVVLTIDRNELVEKPSECARFSVDPDWGIDEEDARQIACDADITEFIQDAEGNLLNYERRRRIVPARLLRALKLRDRSRCRFPGCPHQRYVEAHHVQHWIDGGETCLENLVLLCSAHHRLLHHGTFHVTVEDSDVVFVSRDGEVIEPALQPQFPEVPTGASAGVSAGTPSPGSGTAVGTSPVRCSELHGHLDAGALGVRPERGLVHSDQHRASADQGVPRPFEIHAMPAKMEETGTARVE